MTDSVLFSFTKVDDFLELMIDNEGITTSMFDGTTENFKLILVESCPDNINECLNNDGTLNTDEVSVISEEDGMCKLSWSKGVNANRTISIVQDSIVYDLEDETFLLKGAFLTVATGNASGIVLAYSINNAPMSVQNQIIMPVDGMVWSIVSEVYEG